MERLDRLQSTRGGSKETVLNELIVTPTALLSLPIPVMTVTPVAKLENALRNSVGEAELMKGFVF